MAGHKNSGRTKGATETRHMRELREMKKIITLHKKNLPAADIAKVINKSPQTVSRAIKKFGEYFECLDEVEDYRANKSELLDAAELRILKSMMEGDKISKATLNQAAYAFQQLHNAGRLERGQATNITASYSKVITEDVTNNRVIDVTNSVKDDSE